MKIEENALYQTHHTTDGMQQSMCTVFQKQVDKLAQGSPFVSVLVTESIYMGTTKNLIIYIKLLNNHEIFIFPMTGL